jgi:diamine N-acetyltransferase
VTAPPTVVDHLATRPGPDVLWPSAVPGPGSPQPFYEGYGFVPTGDVYEGEAVLRLDLPLRARSTPTHEEP